MKTAWPKDSLNRLVTCLEEAREKGAETKDEKEAEEKEELDGSDGERTPTGDEGLSEDEEESDEAFEERFRETERKLTERLEMLSLKLNDTPHGKVEGAIKGAEAPTDEKAT
jgi:hypothetical protein